MEIKGLKNRFRDVFGREAVFSFFAPGRINLIGEHTDYNGGYVFPAALNMGTTLLCTPNDSGKLRLFSANFEHLKIIEIDITNYAPAKNRVWANYFIGVLTALKEKGHVLTQGIDCLIYGDIPNGAGLSSSSALTVVFTTALNEVYQFGLEGIDRALIAQKAEHIAGTHCGIMDQFASAMGKKNQAILLDCSTLKYEYVPIELNDYTLVILDSRKKRALNESKYNERRSECEEALKILQTKLPIKTLGELTEDKFFACQEILPEVLRKRARHAVTENARTLKSLQALKAGDLVQFGRYLNDSHYSLRDDYEVTGEELDALTEAARSFPDVLGARMTGAGFGGCCLALVKKGTEKNFIAAVGDEYKDKIGIEARFYVAQIGDGARRI